MSEKRITELLSFASLSESQDYNQHQSINSLRHRCLCAGFGCLCALRDLSSHRRISFDDGSQFLKLYLLGFLIHSPLLISLLIYLMSIISFSSPPSIPLKGNFHLHLEHFTEVHFYLERILDRLTVIVSQNHAYRFDGSPPPDFCHSLVGWFIHRRGAGGGALKD